MTATAAELRRVLEAQQSVIRHTDTQLQLLDVMGVMEVSTATKLHMIFNHAGGRRIAETLGNENAGNFTNVPAWITRAVLKELASLNIPVMSVTAAVCHFDKSALKPALGLGVPPVPWL